MTPGRAARPADRASDDQQLLLVAMCDGQRCRALRTLAAERSPSSPPSSSVIGEAIRATRHSIMLSTGCLGPCAQGAVAVVGAATMSGRALAWVSPPALWASTETEQRAAALSRCITASAITAGAGNGVRTKGS